MLASTQLVRYMSNTPERDGIMSRVQLALNVDDLEEGGHVLLQAVQHRTGQVQGGLCQLRDRRAALKLVLLQNPGKGGTINHLGVEVESSEQVHAEIARLGR